MQFVSKSVENVTKVLIEVAYKVPVKSVPEDPFDPWKLCLYLFSVCALFHLSSVLTCFLLVGLTRVLH